MLKEYIEELTQEIEETSHWRASMVGNPCETFLCHMQLNDDYKPPQGRIMHMLNDGKVHEKDIVERCIASGYQVLHSCLDKQLELSIHLTDKLSVSGHPDGILICGKKTFDLDRYDPNFKFNLPSYLLEITAPNHYAFARLVRDGLESQNYQKFVQTQLYMLAINDKNCVLVAKDKNNTELYEEGISFQSRVIDDLIARLDRVNTLVKKGKLSDYRCDDARKKWCRYRKLCFDRIEDAPLTTQGVLDGRTLKEVTQLLGISAMWHRGKDLEDESEELIEEARMELQQIVEDYGAEGIVIDDIRGKLINSTSRSCDYKTLQQKAPDLYDEVVTTKTKHYIDVRRVK